MPECTWVSSRGTQAGSWRHRRLRKSAVSKHMISRRPARDCTRLIRFLQYPQVLVWPAREWKSLNKMSYRDSRIRILFAVRHCRIAVIFLTVCTRKRSIRFERDEKEITMSVTWCAPSRMNSDGRNERPSRRRNAAENVLHLFGKNAHRLTLSRLINNKTYHGH